MTEVFDLDAIEAETRTDKKPFTFKFGGEKFTLPMYIDQRIIAFMAKDQTYEALGLMFGSQMDRLNKIPAVLDGSRIRALITAWFAYIGENLGESSASTDSSRSTGGRSKRISNASTKSPSRTSSPED